MCSAGGLVAGMPSGDVWLCGEHRLQPARAWPGKLGPFWVSQPGPPAFLIRVSSFEGVVNCFYERKQLCFSAPFHCTDVCHLHLEESGWSRMVGS